MLTLVEGVTPTFEEECGCGGENCDGSGFPDSVTSAVYKHEETGHHWVVVFTVLTAMERVMSTVDPMMMLLSGVTPEAIIERTGVQGIADGRAFVCSPEGIIPNFAQHPVIGHDLDNGTEDEIRELLLRNIEQFHGLPSGMLTDDDMARLLTTGDETGDSD